MWLWFRHAASIARGRPVVSGARMKLWLKAPGVLPSG